MAWVDIEGIDKAENDLEGSWKSIEFWRPQRPLQQLLYPNLHLICVLFTPMSGILHTLKDVTFGWGIFALQIKVKVQIRYDVAVKWGISALPIAGTRLSECNPTKSDFEDVRQLERH